MLVAKFTVVSSSMLLGIKLFSVVFIDIVYIYVTTD
jgi:hypothetical protein